MQHFTWNYLIYNAIGQKVLAGELTNQEIRTDRLEKGMYFVELSYKGYKIVKKLLIE